MLDLEKYRFSIELSPIPLMLVSADGNISLTNLPFDELFKYEKGELIGQPVEALVPKEISAHHPELRNAYSRFPTKRRMGENRDLTGITKTGRHIPLELALEPIVDDDQTWALVVAIDIRSRKQIEERVRLVLDTAASAMLMIDESSKINFVNQTALDLTGYSEADLQNQSISILIPDNVKRVHPVYVGSFMHNKSKRSMGETGNIHVRHKDGTNIPVEIALTPVITDGSELVVCTISDLRERVQAKETLEKKNLELAELNQDLSQFTYSASHDLKAPLSTIVGLIKICIEDLDENNLSEVRENFSKVLEIAQRSGEKVESILYIARASRETIPVVSTSIKQEINNVWTDIVGPKSKYQLKLDLNHQDPVLIEKTTFGIIVENLISNAVRYLDENKKTHEIIVQSSENATELHVSISDNGIGIPPENLDKLFLMFTRLDERSGDGLGLALVKKQLDRLGGKITVSSTVGEGTKFDFFIPKAEGGHK